MSAELISPEPLLASDDSEAQAKAAREALVRGLRDVATFYEEHPALPLPIEPSLMIVLRTPEQMTSAAREFGSFDKESDAHWFSLIKGFGPVRLQAFSAREVVCTKRVVGREKVQEKVPVQFEEREVEREIVEWDCHPLLNGGRLAPDAHLEAAHEDSVRGGNAD